MRELLENIAGANVSLGAVTVVIIQILKMYLPSDPNAPVGQARFTVDPKYKKYLLLGSFVIGTLITVVLAPIKDAGWRVQVANGLQTGSYAVVYWELYSNLLSGKSG